MMEILKCLHLILNIFTILMIQSAVSVNVFYSNYYHRSADVTILGQFRSEGNAASLVDCVTRRADSSTVKFDENTKQCYSYSDMNYTVIPSTGGDVWFNTRNKVFIAQRSDNSMMTLAEASSLCEQVQGHLSSTMELYTAWSKGYHMCRCGWLVDSTVRFTLKFDDPSCDLPRTTQNSMIACKDLLGMYPNLVSNAYCTRN